MRPLSFLLALIAAVVVQTAALAAGPAVGRVCDAFVIVALLWSVRSTPVAAIFYGLCAGWAADALAGTPLGLHGIATTVAAFAVAFAGQRLVLDRGAGLLAACAAGALVQQLVLWPLAAAFAPGAMPASPLWVLARALCVGVLAALASGLGRRLRRRLGLRRSARSSRLRFR